MKKIVTNPYLPNFEYIPDGEPHVFNGRVYVYGSHDRFNGNNFCLNDYVTWSAPIDDLSDWRYEGVIWRKIDDPTTNGKRAYYAPDACQGPDGKFYLYYSPSPGISTRSWVIHCAVADNPAGPFKYHGNVDLKKWSKNYLLFDPAVYVEDGRVYLYYGSAMFYPLLDVRSKSVLGGAVVELDPKDMLTVIDGPV
ncbi:MAG: family 43 glycosylhydrolase, partial [Erysipelotrichia bacterium]|nr:family 43 glycosylhydrolase [Erysipelotrichia bacterium]